MKIKTTEERICYNKTKEALRYLVNVPEHLKTRKTVYELVKPIVEEFTGKIGIERMTKIFDKAIKKVVNE